VRVLFVASAGEPGGAELALETYIAHLPAHVEGHGLVLSPGPMAAALAGRLGRSVAVGDLTGRPSPERTAAFARTFRGELRRVRPDVVLATGVKAAALCALTCRAARVPLVWHKVDFSRDAQLAVPLATMCRGVVAVSGAVAQTVPPSRRLAVVPPPVRLAPEFRIPSPRPPATIGSLGRLVPYKGHADVITAAARLRPRFPDVRVVIAGGADRSAPDHGDALLAHAAALGIAEQVELIGHVKRVEEVYAQLTVVVQATYRDADGFGREGFGAVLAEASWAGLPVVGTSGGGSADALREGVTGRLVAPRDGGALAEAIGGYLADPAAAAAAGDAGAAFTRERLAPAPLAARLVAALERVAR
jgi:glycosyltransferase involved in cell wall biosynthesis